MNLWIGFFIWWMFHSRGCLKDKDTIPSKIKYLLLFRLANCTIFTLVIFILVLVTCSLFYFIFFFYFSLRHSLLELLFFSITFEIHSLGVLSHALMFFVECCIFYSFETPFWVDCNRVNICVVNIFCFVKPHLFSHVFIAYFKLRPE